MRNSRFDPVLFLSGLCPGPLPLSYRLRKPAQRSTPRGNLFTLRSVGFRGVVQLVRQGIIIIFSSGLRTVTALSFSLGRGAKISEGAVNSVSAYRIKEAAASSSHANRKSKESGHSSMSSADSVERSAMAMVHLPYSQPLNSPGFTISVLPRFRMSGS